MQVSIMLRILLTLQNNSKIFVFKRIIFLLIVWRHL